MTTKLILASQSPRRARLLKEAGIAFTRIPSRIKETTTFKKPELVVKELSYKKALSVALKNPGRPVLGSDTIVFCKGRILNKPKNEADAMRLLRLQNGAAVSLSLSWSLVADRDRHYMRLLGTRGSGSIQPLAVHKEIEQGLLDVTPQVPPGRENMYTASYRDELEDFVETARGHRPIELPWEQVPIMKLVALCYQSAAEGREVEIS